MKRFDDPLARLSAGEQQTLDTTALDLAPRGAPPVRIVRNGTAVIVAAAGLPAVGAVGLTLGAVSALLLAVGVAALIGVHAGRASCAPAPPVSRRAGRSLFGKSKQPP